MRRTRRRWCAVLLAPAVVLSAASPELDQGCSGYTGSTCDDCRMLVSPCPTVSSAGLDRPHTCNNDCVAPEHLRRAGILQCNCELTCDSSCDSGCNWIGTSCDSGCDGSCDQCAGPCDLPVGSQTCQCPTPTPPAPTPQPPPPTPPPSPQTQSPSRTPTAEPSGLPSQSPTPTPTTAPTVSPSQTPSSGPASSPTSSPTTQAPTWNPSGSPTLSPTSPTHEPTASPSGSPTSSPTESPTQAPTVNPTGSPSLSPTKNPTQTPTENPSGSPTSSPTRSPTRAPTGNPSGSPTSSPTSPTTSPTQAPTGDPSGSPTASPTSPTGSPTQAPTRKPSDSPTSAPTSPTGSPTQAPTRKPSDSPTSAPTSPTGSPTQAPTGIPSGSPTSYPTEIPTPHTKDPSGQPTRGSRSASPTASPAQPWRHATDQPNTNDSGAAAVMPTVQTSSVPGEQQTAPSSSPTTDQDTEDDIPLWYIIVPIGTICAAGCILWKFCHWRRADGNVVHLEQEQVDNRHDLHQIGDGGVAGDGAGDADECSGGGSSETCDEHRAADMKRRWKRAHYLGELLYQLTANLKSGKHLKYSGCVERMGKWGEDFRLAIHEWMFCNDCPGCMELISNICGEMKRRVMKDRADQGAFQVAKEKWWPLMTAAGFICSELVEVLRHDGTYSGLAGSCAEDPAQECFHRCHHGTDVFNEASPWLGNVHPTAPPLAAPPACRRKYDRDELLLARKMAIMDTVYKHAAHLCQMTPQDAKELGLSCRVFVLFAAPVFVYFGFRVDIILGEHSHMERPASSPTTGILAASRPVGSTVGLTSDDVPGVDHMIISVAFPEERDKVYVDQHGVHAHRPRVAHRGVFMYAKGTSTNVDSLQSAPSSRQAQSRAPSVAASPARPRPRRAWSPRPSAPGSTSLYPPAYSSTSPTVNDDPVIGGFEPRSSARQQVELRGRQSAVEPEPLLPGQPGEA
eukprot:TRINITY_DN425_c0_g1_i4.p1 TRINITY_DN425_c0_g1~~TRINITY_DN425_c0_g1_i4.p1  ORF type:complete len:984 (+),score=35.62 TRINITY_DN425_c0_g1_i4:79-2952(+)